MTEEEQATLELAHSLRAMIDSHSINRFERASAIAVLLACARDENDRLIERKQWEAKQQVVSVASVDWETPVTFEQAV